MDQIQEERTRIRSSDLSSQHPHLVARSPHLSIGHPGRREEQRPLRRCRPEQAETGYPTFHHQPFRRARYARQDTGRICFGPQGMWLSTTQAARS